MSAWGRESLPCPGTLILVCHGSITNSGSEVPTPGLSVTLGSSQLWLNTCLCSPSVKEGNTSQSPWSFPYLTHTVGDHEMELDPPELIEVKEVCLKVLLGPYPHLVPNSRPMLYLPGPA